MEDGTAGCKMVAGKKQGSPHPVQESEAEPFNCVQAAGCARSGLSRLKDKEARAMPRPKSQGGGHGHGPSPGDHPASKRRGCTTHVV